MKSGKMWRNDRPRAKDGLSGQRSVTLNPKPYTFAILLGDHT